MLIIFIQRFSWNCELILKLIKCWIQKLGESILNSSASPKQSYYVNYVRKINLKLVLQFSARPLIAHRNFERKIIINEFWKK